ncbi:AraC family transcriptional regulator, partial [Rhizobiaceae sp. 2RAB30]
SGLGEFPHIGPDPKTHVAGHAGTTGSYKVFGIRPGMNLSVFDVVAGARFGTPPVATGPCLAIDVLFQASGEGWLLPPGDSQGISIPYRSGNLYLFFAAQGVRGRYDIPVGTRFRGVDLRVDLAFLERLGASELLADLRTSHPLHAASCAGCWIGMLPLPAVLAPAAKALLDLGLSDG